MKGGGDVESLDDDEKQTRKMKIQKILQSFLRQIVSDFAIEKNKPAKGEKTQNELLLLRRK